MSAGIAKHRQRDATGASTLLPAEPSREIDELKVTRKVGMRIDSRPEKLGIM